MESIWAITKRLSEARAFYADANDTNNSLTIRGLPNSGGASSYANAAVPRIIQYAQIEKSIMKSKHKYEFQYLINKYKDPIKRVSVAQLKSSKELKCERTGVLNTVVLNKDKYNVVGTIFHNGYPPESGNHCYVIRDGKSA